MTRIYPVILILGMAVFRVNPALGQPPGPPGPPEGMGPPPAFQLLMQKSVQKELKLTAAQKRKLAALAMQQQAALQKLLRLPPEERMRKSHEALKENDQAATDLLKPEQARRLKQIGLQHQGAQALGNPEVADEVGITAEQRTTIKEIDKETGEQIRGLLQKGRLNPLTGEKKMAALRKKGNEKILALLTTEQKAKWKELTGKPFKGTLRLGPPGGFPPPPPPQRP